MSLFTPVASWAFGYAGASLGYSERVILSGGGAANLGSRAALYFGRLIAKSRHLNNIEGEFYNNIANVDNIKNGFKAFFQNNPYTQFTFSLSGVATSNTGYTGKGTGYATPAERGPGPGVQMWSPGGAEVSPSSRVAMPESKITNPVTPISFTPSPAITPIAPPPPPAPLSNIRTAATARSAVQARSLSPNGTPQPLLVAFLSSSTLFIQTHRFTITP